MNCPPGGPTFVYDASVHPKVDGDSPQGDSYCFRFRNDKLDDASCTKSYSVICQFTPATVPTDYELRNGKYYKVFNFICASSLYIDGAIFLPKLYTVKEDWEKAKTICNTDGGALSSVLTQDDVSALNYYSNINPYNNTLIGLRKTEAAMCVDGTCDGKLRWQDGHQFVFNSLIYDYIRGDASTQDHNCFRRSKIYTRYVGGDCNMLLPFLCQIACQGENIIALT